MGYQEHVQVIENWMSAISEDGGVERYDDLRPPAMEPGHFIANPRLPSCLRHNHQVSAKKQADT